MLLDTFHGPCRRAGLDGSGRAGSHTLAPLPGGVNGSGSPRALGPDAPVPGASVPGDLGRRQAEPRTCRAAGDTEAWAPVGLAPSAPCPSGGRERTAVRPGLTEAAGTFAFSCAFVRGLGPPSRAGGSQSEGSIWPPELSPGFWKRPPKP